MAARATTNDHEFTMMEQLPIDLTCHILGFMDIPIRLKFAGLNNRLRRRVFQECSDAWRTIDFSKCHFRVREKLKDFDLSRLLINVNAGQVTKKLLLTFCGAIQGPGLVPLRNSRVLESIYLAGTAADGAPNQALWILNSCIQHKLQFVGFSQDAVRNAGVIFKAFMRRFRKAKLDRAVVNQSRCSSCQYQIMNESRQLVASLHGVPEFRCGMCRKQYCRRVNCVDVKECQNCSLTACGDCDAVFQCILCSRIKCYPCDRYGYKCSCCDRGACGDCLKQRPFERCSHCSDLFCEDCAEHPPVCDEDCCLCKDCLELGTCGGCKSQFCVSCANGNWKNCNYYKCGERYCSESNCLDHVEECGQCGCSYCKEHDLVVYCSKCQERHCHHCAGRCERPAKRAKTM